MPLRRAEQPGSPCRLHSRNGSESFSPLRSGVNNTTAVLVICTSVAKKPKKSGRTTPLEARAPICSAQELAAAILTRCLPVPREQSQLFFVFFLHFSMYINFPAQPAPDMYFLNLTISEIHFSLHDIIIINLIVSQICKLKAKIFYSGRLKFLSICLLLSSDFFSVL